MGISITAAIAYGCWYDPEDEDLDWMDALRDEDDDFDFDAIIARHAGIEPLDYSGYPEQPRFPYTPEQDKEHRQAVKEWREANDADAYYARRREAINAAPLDIDHAGHGDNPIYVIHIRGLRFEAYWAPEPVPDELDYGLSAERIDEARAFAAELGILWNSPEWLLYPYYSH